MSGTGPFLFLSRSAPPLGFREVPEGGMCLSVFVLLRRGGELLLGRYAEHPDWERLAGLDADRVRAHSAGWTIPGSHLKIGESPAEAAARVVREHLGLGRVELSGPRVATEWETHWRRPEEGRHFDVWFVFEGAVAGAPAAPPWYAELRLLDPSGVSFARGHGDVLASGRA